MGCCYNERKKKFDPIGDLNQTDLDDSREIFSPKSNRKKVKTKKSKKELKKVRFEIKVTTFDCFLINYFKIFHSHFSPQLRVSFREHSDIINYQRKDNVEGDEDYLNRSGNYETYIGSPSKKIKSSPIKIEPIKTLHRYYFNANPFVIDNFSLVDLMRDPIKGYINFSLSHLDVNENKNFFIGDSSLPLHLLYTNIQDEQTLEIPITNQIEDSFIGNLFVEVVATTNSEDVIEIKNKLRLLHSIEDYVKFNLLTIYDYSPMALNNSVTENELAPISQLEESKMKIYEILQDYTVNDQSQAMSNLSSFLTDNKNLTQFRYYTLIWILNEIVSKPERNIATTLKNLNFFNQKEILIPAENLEDSRNMILIGNVMLLLINLKKNIDNISNDNYSVNYMMKLFEAFNQRAKKHLHVLLDPFEFTRTQHSIGPVSDDWFILCRNIVYRYLKLLQLSVDYKTEKLEEKAFSPFLELAAQDDMEKLFECFQLDILQVQYKLKGEMKPFNFLKDHNYVIGVLHLVKSYVSLGQTIARNKKISMIEYFIKNLLGRGSNFISWISHTLPLYNSSPKYISLLLEILYEIVQDVGEIFFFNFFSRVNLNNFFNGFNIYIQNKFDSRKFPTIYLFFSIMTKTTKMVKGNEMVNFDFIELDWKLTLEQICSVYCVIDANHYFNIKSNLAYEYNKDKMRITITSSKTKFMHHKIAIRVQQMFFQILSALTIRKDLAKKFVSHLAFKKTIQRVVFLSITKFDKEFSQIAKLNAKTFVDTYTSIINLLENIKDVVDLDNAITRALEELVKDSQQKQLNMKRVVEKLNHRIKDCKSLTINEKTQK